MGAGRAKKALRVLPVCRDGADWTGGAGRPGRGAGTLNPHLHWRLRRGARRQRSSAPGAEVYSAVVLIVLCNSSLTLGPIVEVRWSPRI